MYNSVAIFYSRTILTLQCIRYCDSDDSALTQEQIRGIIQYLPTSEEKAALRGYLDGATIDSLCECEKFMVAIMAVKHAKRKLNAILFIQKFDSSLAELQRGKNMLFVAL